MNAILEQINSAGYAFVEFAVPMLVQSSVLILMLLLADLLLRKKVRSVFRYFIWMLVLVKLILPTTLSSPVSLGYWFGDKLQSVKVSDMDIAAEPADLQYISEAEPIGSTSIPTSVTSPEEFGATETLSEGIEPVDAEATGWPVEPASAITWQGVVLLVWVVIVAAMGLLLLQRAIFVIGLVAQAKGANRLMEDSLEYCRKRVGVKGKIGLKVSANATSPAVCGLFRPVILVPENLGPSLGAGGLRVVLMHELAHIKRGDLWVNLAQTVLQIIYFYNPLLWLANLMIRRVREQAIDEMVQVAMGEKAKQYPETLVNVAKLAFKRPALSLRLIGVVESKSALKGRIKHMLGRPIPKSAKLGIFGLVVVIIIGCALLPMAKTEKEVGLEAVFPETLNEAQKIYMEWTGERFGDYLDRSEYAELSESTKAELEAKWIEILQGPWSKKYYDAINCLAAIKSKKAVDPLLKIATEHREKDNRDRWMATRALGIIGDESVVPELIHLIYHYNQNTRFWAQISLVRLTGKNFGCDWQRWSQCWNEEKGKPTFMLAKVTWTSREDWADEEVQKEKDKQFCEQLSGKAKRKLLSSPPFVSRSEIITKTIYPGVGLDVIRVGETGEEVRALLGEPKYVKGFRHGTAMLDYRERLSIDFFVNEDEETISEIRFNKGFQGRTTDGIGLGDLLNKVLEVSGGPKKTVEATTSQTHNVLLGRDRVLYKQMDRGELMAYKFIDAEKGVLYWFDTSGKVTQIVVFEASPVIYATEKIAIYPIDFEITNSVFLEHDWIGISELIGTSKELKTGEMFTLRGKYRLGSHNEAMLHLYATNGETTSEQGPVVKKGSGDFSRTFRYLEEGDLHLSFYPAGGGSSFGGIYFKQKEPSPEESSLVSKKFVERVPYAAKLANGVTVELVGICEYPSEGKQWWRPDGRLLDKAPYKTTGSILPQHEDYKYYEFVIRLKGPKDISVKWDVPSGRQGSYTGNPRDEKGQIVEDLYVYTINQPEDKKSAFVRTGLSTAPWQTLATHPVDVREETYTLDDNKRAIAFGRAYQEDGRTVLPVTRSLNRGPDKVALRVIAVTHSGREVRGSVSGRGGNILSSNTHEFDLPLKDIKEFRFQTRPYEWVTFKNVSLRPNFKADVQVEVEQLLPMAKEMGSEQAEVIAIGRISKDTSGKLTYHLDEGITLEILGLTNWPVTSDSVWWAVDGTILKKPALNDSERKLISKSGCDEQEGRQRYMVVCRSEEPDGVTVHFLAKSLSGPKVYVPYAKNTLNKLMYVVSAAEETVEAKGVALTAKVASGNWQTVEKFSIADEAGTTEGGMAYTAAKVGWGKTMVTLSSTRPFSRYGRDTEMDYRVVAVDKQGREHIWKSGAGASTRDDLFTHKFTFGISKKKIDHLEIQHRPFRIFAFRNISLEPGQRTDVQVEVERTRQVNLRSEQRKSAVSVSPGGLQQLIDSAQRGGTVIVPKGVYTEPIEINKSLTLKGESRADCVFEVTDDKPAIFVDTRGKGKVTIEGITIKWQLATSDNMRTPFALYVSDSKAEVKNCSLLPLGNFKRSVVAVRADGFSNLTISRCRFEGFEYVVCYGEGTEGTVSDNLIMDCGHQGITLYEGAKAHIIRNVITGSRYHAVRSTGGTLFMKDNLIINNANRGVYLGNKTAQGTISNNIIMGNATGISGFAESRVKIENNIIADSSYAGIGMRESCSLSIRNNIFQGNERGWILFKEGGKGGNTVYRNTFWKNRIDAENFRKTANSVEAEPDFVDPENGDFSLRRGLAKGYRQGLTKPQVLKTLWKRWQNRADKNEPFVDAGQTDVQVGVDKPRVISVSPASGSEMALISELQVVFDRPMMADQFEIVDASLEDEFKYLSKVSAIEAYAVYDENKYQFTIPLTLPCNWNGLLKLGGFKSVKGVDAEPVVLNYSTLREKFSKELLERFEKAKESKELKALVEKVKEMRSNLKSLSETVKVVWDYGDAREKREQQMVFKMQGDKQFYADMSKAFDMPWHIGSDGDKCWFYYESKREKKLVMTDFDDIPEKNIAICEPFGVGKYDIDEVIKLNNLEYVGTEMLDGRKCHLARAWLAYVQVDRAICKVNTWWIDAETYMPVQLVTDSGYVIRSQHFIYEKINQPIDYSEFRPDFVTDIEPEEAEPLGDGYERRYVKIIDGSGTGRMSVRWGKRGPAGTSSSGLN